MDYLIVPHLTRTKGKCNEFKEILLREEFSTAGFNKVVW